MTTLPPSITLPANTVVGNAASDAEPAEAIPFATLASLILGYLQDTSTSSVAIGTGSLTFQCSTGKAFQPGQYLVISDSADATKYVSGSVTSYDATTGVLVLNSIATGGSGTFASWNVALSGPQGATGATGATGSSYPAAQHAYTTAETAPTSDANAEFELGGSAFYTLTFSAASGYPAAYSAIVTNTDTGRGKLIAPNGLTSFILWPGQTCRVYNQSNAWRVDPPAQRWANGSCIIYVDATNGSDSNDGLVAYATATNGPLATITKAYTVIKDSIDCQGSPPTIQLADGTYSVGAGININYPLVGAAQLYIIGNTTTPANVIVSCSTGGNCFNARDLSTVTLSGMTLSTTGNGSVALSASQGATIDICGTGPVNFDAFPLGTHMSANTWASLNVLGNYTINGGAAQHIISQHGGYINYGSFTVTGGSGMAFTTFAEAVTCGVIDAGGVAMTFSGFASVTGARYAAQQNGVINSSSTTYPGSSAGSTATGGLYS